MDARQAIFRTTAMIAVSGSLISTAFPAPPPEAANVILTGFLHAEGYTMADMVVEVAMNGAAYQAVVSSNGRFTIALPQDTKATLRFEKPGHVTKEVLVDTRHGQDGEFKHRTRRVRFAVILELESHMAGLTYTGPVGAIAFDADGGCVAVSHTRSLLPARRNKTMVF